MATLLDRIHAEIRERLEQNRPAAEEYERLEAALAVLESRPAASERDVLESRPAASERDVLESRPAAFERDDAEPPALAA